MRQLGLLLGLVLAGVAWGQPDSVLIIGDSMAPILLEGHKYAVVPPPDSATDLPRGALPLFQFSIRATRGLPPLVKQVVAIPGDSIATQEVPGDTTYQWTRGVFRDSMTVRPQLGDGWVGLRGPNSQGEIIRISANRDTMDIQELLFHPITRDTIQVDTHTVWLAVKRVKKGLHFLPRAPAPTGDVVPPNQVYVRAANRTSSIDSRRLGLISFGRIIGLVLPE